MDNTEQASVSTTVTRPKHPGRVAQGKILAALMKECKDALMKNMESEGDLEVIKEQSSHTSYSAGLGIILFIVGVGGGIYFYSRKTPPPAPEPVKQQVKKWME